MEQLQLEDFLKYKFLSNIQVSDDESKVVFVVNNSQEDKKGYVNNLYCYDGKVRQLTQSGKVSNYCLWDNNTVLFQDKNQGNLIVFKWLDLETGCISEAFKLPLANASIKKVNDSEVVIFSTINKNYPDLYKDEKRDQIIEEIKEEADYEILDENPFWFNGAGFINGNRTALFTMNVNDPSTLTRVSDKLVKIEGSEFVGGKLYVLAEEFVTKSDRFPSIYVLEDGKLNHVYSDTVVHITSISHLGDELIVLGTDEKLWGINQNPTIYKLKDGKLEMFYDNQEGLDSSVGSDCRFGHGRDMMGQDDFLYYVSTRVNDSFLFKLTKDAKEVQLTNKNGSVDDFYIVNGNAYYIAMQCGKLQEVYKLDGTNGEVTTLTSFNEHVLDGKYVADYEEVTYVYNDDFMHNGKKLHENTTIYGWVLKPKDYDPNKKYPAILDVHGGPKTVYGTTFYHEMQYWANHGYFVMYCNPIGGDGRGNEFFYLSGQFGTYDFDSLMGWVDKVLETYPAIDTTKVCETGGSYGGFMTNWIIGHTNRFCACASQRSISNWISFAGTSDIGYLFDLDQCKVDDVIAEGDKLWKRSPLAAANDVTTPTLFIHSDEDYRCPMEQALQLMSALIQNGVETRMCYFHGENHELSRGGMPKHRIKRLKEITNWFDAHTNKGE